MKKRDEILYEMKVDVLKALANPVRLRIAEILLSKEMSVNQIVEALGLERTSVSKHLSILQKANILKSRREGTTVHYSLLVPCIVNIFGCMEEVLKDQAKAKFPIIRDLASN